MKSVSKYLYLICFVVFFYSCVGENEYHRKEDNFLGYHSYNVFESTHFIFVSKNIEFSRIRELADKSENVYYLISYELGNNYFFREPYKIFVYSYNNEKFNDIDAKKDAEIVWTTNSFCFISGVVASLMLKDVLGDYIDIYPVLYYGYKNYYERKNCLSKENYYSSLISNFLKKGIDPIYFVNISNPKTLREKDFELYNAISSSLIEFLIGRYSQFKFILLLNELKKGSSFYDAIDRVYLFYPGEFKKNFKEYLTQYE